MFDGPHLLAIQLPASTQIPQSRRYMFRLAAPVFLEMSRATVAAVSVMRFLWRQ